MRAIFTAVWTADVESREEAEELRSLVASVIEQDFARAARQFGFTPEEAAERGTDIVGVGVTLQE